MDSTSGGTISHSALAALFGGAVPRRTTGARPSRDAPMPFRAQRQLAHPPPPTPTPAVSVAAPGLPSPLWTPRPPARRPVSLRASPFWATAAAPSQAAAPAWPAQQQQQHPQETHELPTQFQLPSPAPSRWTAPPSWNAAPAPAPAPAAAAWDPRRPPPAPAAPAFPAPEPVQYHQQYGYSQQQQHQQHQQHAGAGEIGHYDYDAHPGGGGLEAQWANLTPLAVLEAERDAVADAPHLHHHHQQHQQPAYYTQQQDQTGYPPTHEMEQCSYQEPMTQFHPDASQFAHQQQPYAYPEPPPHAQYQLEPAPPAHEFYPAAQLAAQNGGHLPVRLVSELPSRFRALFSFPAFNYVQSECFDAVMHSDQNLVVSAPTGSGKTAILELALVRLFSTTANIAHAKAVYLAPTKALCAERAADWSRKLAPLGIQVQELTGDSTYAAAMGARSAQVLVVTPEKWDSVTRRWRDSRNSVAQLSLLLIDEVHMVSSARGSTLEALVSRVKVIARELSRPIRCVALSATFPNLEDVAQWLDGAALFRFGEEYRPVQLEKLVVGLPAGNKSSWFFDRMMDERLPLLIRQHAKGKPCLVFCATRKATESAAKAILAESATCPPGSPGHELVRTAAHAAALDQASQGVHDATLRDLVKHGLAFHHAGLSQHDRQTVERLFLASHIAAVCTTSTLAVGVNLPAYLVIIKGTTAWENGAEKEYAGADVLQMIGRAGRPQFDTEGKVVIMTDQALVVKYETLIEGRDVIDSCLDRHLAEHLNAEIAQGTIASERAALEWLSSTFFYVRHQRAPERYATGGDLAGLINITLATLVDAGMVERVAAPLTGPNPPHAPPRLQCTELGRIMCRYCLSLGTMRALVAAGPSIPQQLYALAHGEELGAAYLKPGDKAVLNDLNKQPGIRFPLAGRVAVAADKVYLVVQAVLGGVALQGKERDRIRLLVSRETSLVWQHLARIASAHVEVCATQVTTGAGAGEPGSADRLRYALLVAQSVRARLWFDSTRVLRQLDKLGPVMTSTLATAGIHSFDDLVRTPPWRVEQLLHRNPPFGTALAEAAKQLPRFAITVAPADPSVPPTLPARYLDVTVSLPSTASSSSSSARAKPAWAAGSGGPAHAVLLVHDDQGKMLDHVRQKWDALRGGGQPWTVRVHATPPGRVVFVSVLCEHMVGLDAHAQFDVYGRTLAMLPRWQLPESAMALPAQTAAAPPVTNGNAATGPAPSTQGSAAQPAARSTLPAQQTRVPAAIAPPPPQPCQHKCRDKAKCKHVCCKRGLPDGTAHPAPAAASSSTAAANSAVTWLHGVAVPPDVRRLPSSDSDLSDAWWTSVPVPAPGPRNGGGDDDDAVFALAAAEIEARPAVAPAPPAAPVVRGKYRPLRFPTPSPPPSSTPPTVVKVEVKADKEPEPVAENGCGGEPPMPDFDRDADWDF
ncbi:ATP-dependent DNA helicase MER3 [Blastocladiella emersonii ATCC 22665]|nr:ATP-dependent DNA helicase MER3 [Blastocladiella emersonii ATCC 22665]